MPVSYAPAVIICGDSLVLGVGDVNGDGMRRALYTAMAAQDTPIFFTGTTSTGTLTADPWHNGTGGAVISTIQGQANSAMTAWTPDIAILEGGTNDIAASATAATVVASWSSYLDSVWARNTKRWFQIIALNILRRLDAFDPVVQQVNALLPAMVAGKSYSANVQIANFYGTTSLSSDYSDAAVHLFASGYANAATLIAPTLATAVSRVMGSRA